MNQIIPAILAQDETVLFLRLRSIENLVPLVQIDITDGKLVPNASWSDIEALNNISTPTFFELHLMVEDPEIFIRQTEKILKIKRVIWHLEAMGNHRELLNLVHSYGKEAGLAISPKTPVDSLQSYIGRMDEVLILGVNPGLSGQTIIPETVKKIHQIHERWNDLAIGFDGGVNLTNILVLKQAGVTRFCTSSAIFDNPDIEVALKELQQA